jgi:hypothetical protein
LFQSNLQQLGLRLSWRACRLCEGLEALDFVEGIGNKTRTPKCMNAVSAQQWLLCSEETGDPGHTLELQHGTQEKELL